MSALFRLLALLGCACAVSAQPYVFINHQQGSSVDVYDGDGMALIRSIPSLEGPAGIAISADDDWLAVSYPEQGMVSFMDSRRLIPLEHVNVGGSPFGLAVADKKLFYSDWNGGFVGVIAPESGRLLKKIAVGEAPAGLTAVACKPLLLVANRESGSVSVIDARSLSHLKDIPVGEGPFALDNDGRFAYVANSRSNTLSIIDLARLVEIERISTGRMPYGVAIDRQQQKVYVSNQSENSVSVFDAVKRQMTGTFKTGAYPENIAVDEAGRRVYVLNWFDASLSVFDTRTYRELTRIKLEEGSRAFGQFVAKPIACELKSEG